MNRERNRRGGTEFGLTATDLLERSDRPRLPPEGRKEIQDGRHTTSAQLLGKVQSQANEMENIRDCCVLVFTETPPQHPASAAWLKIKHTCPSNEGSLAHSCVLIVSGWRWHRAGRGLRLWLDRQPESGEKIHSCFGILMQSKTIRHLCNITSIILQMS